MRAIRARTISLLAGAVVLLTGAGSAFAACTPGIPCLPGEFTVGAGENEDKSDFSDRRNTCDGDVMNQIHARAFMEAQRETLINQTNIRKPDSVLAYTCFDQYIGTASENAPPIFSESAHWQGMTVKTSVTGKPQNFYPPTRTLNVYMGKGNNIPLMNGMALGPASNFTRDNFQHDFLGDSATGLTYALASSVTPYAQMNCEQMQAVWTAAKCQNANLLPSSSKTFYSLKDLTYDPTNSDGSTAAQNAAKDPRQLPRLPRACTYVAAGGGSGGSLAGSTTGITTAHEQIATNPPPRYKQYEAGNITEGGSNGSYPAVKVDGIRHLTEQNKDDYFDPKLQPFDGGPDGCAPAVRTGLQLIERSATLDEFGAMTIEAKTHEDAVCPNPECYHSLGTCKSIP